MTDQKAAVTATAPITDRERDAEITELRAEFDALRDAVESEISRHDAWREVHHHHENARYCDAMLRLAKALGGKP